MATTNCYDRLYENMKNRLTVVDNDLEYTLGDYMLKKAHNKKEESLLPVTQRTSVTKSERAVAMILSFVNDKLTIKAPPAKDKTIRRFPFRASASALLSAVVACTFMLAFCLVGARLISTGSSDENYSVEMIAEADSEIESEQLPSEAKN